MTETNSERQEEEKEALSSIYGDDWCMISDHEYSIQITADDNHTHSHDSICLEVIFTADYPKDGPPNYQLSAPWLKGDARLKIVNSLNEVYLENIGESIIYLWVEKIREFIQEQIDSDSSNPKKVDEDYSSDDEEFDLSALEITSPDHTSPEDDGLDWECPVITQGEVIIDRNSRFQGHIAPVVHVKQTKLVLASLMENRKIATATHNIWAYRILKDETSGHPTFYQTCEDDGETHAGSRLLHLLQIVDARNVMVVVTRWYGGVHLGPDRFKHINNCARILLDQHGYVKSKEEKKGPKSSSGGKKKKK